MYIFSTLFRMRLMEDTLVNNFDRLNMLIYLMAYLKNILIYIFLYVLV
jgi:hypothetical protein